MKHFSNDIISRKNVIWFNQPHNSDIMQTGGRIRVERRGVESEKKYENKNIRTHTYAISSLNPNVNAKRMKILSTI